MISVIEAAETYQLTTVAKVKTLLGVEVSDTSKDDLLEMLIDQVTERVQEECGRVFAREEVTESLQGTGMLRMFLSRRPLIYVTEVRLSGGIVDPSQYSVENRETSCLYNAGTWLQQRFTVGVGRTAYSPQLGEEMYEIDYIAGYWLPGFTGSPSASDFVLPKSLESLVQEMVVSSFRQVGIDQNIQGYSIGDYSVQFRNLANPQSDEWSKRLLRYAVL